MPTIPQFGDPQLLPKGLVVAPSAERMPFDAAGVLRPEGPELPADFMLAPDITDLPWRRARGDEWTDAAFRAVVLGWLQGFLAARSGIREWQVIEKATALRSSTRVSPDDSYLVLSLVRTDAVRVEVAAPFPRAKRSSADALVILGLMGASLDALGT